MKNKTVCFTGHREIPQENKDIIAEKLQNTLEELISQGYSCFCAGGAMGFDTLAAKTVLTLKKKYSDILLCLILPCKTQADKWSEEDRKQYDDIINQADKVTILAEHYFRGCMQVRNRQLVDNSSLCICFLTEEKGGTFFTVNYARKKELTVINIADLI